MKKGTSEVNGGSKPTQKSLMSHFFGQKPSKTPAETVALKEPEIVVLDEPVVNKDTALGDKDKPVVIIEEVEASKEEVKEKVMESPSAVTAAPVVTPSPPPVPAVEVSTGRRSSRIATNAEAYAKAYYEKLANAPPESPPKKSRRSRDSDEEYDDAEPKRKTSSFFLSNKDKLALKEKERQEKIRLEQERLDRLEAERQAQLLREAQERDKRMHEQLIRTREENNKFFCMSTGEDGVVRQKQMIRNADGMLEEVEVTITSNPFFNARVATNSSSSGANVSNLEEEAGDVPIDLGTLFSTLPACGSNAAYQLIKSHTSEPVTVVHKRTATDSLSHHFEAFLASTPLAVQPTATSLDLAYLSFEFACRQDSRYPVNPQYVTGSTPLNLRMLWLLYFSQYCGKFLESSTSAVTRVGAAAAAPAPVVTASIFSNFLTPKIARPPSTTSLNSATTGVSTSAGKSVAGSESALVGNLEARLVLQQWLEEWAGKRRTPKKPKNKGKAASGKKGGKRGRRDDDDYSSEDDAWSSDNEEEGLSNVLLLLGSSGSNKTATVYHYAKQLGYNVMEVNASMVRSRANIQKMFSEGVQSQSMASAMDFSQPDGNDDDDVRANGKKSNTSSKSFLTNSGVAKNGSGSGKSSGVDVSKKSLNLILFDEMDVVFEEEDTHFHSSIVSLSKVSKCPIVLTSETLCPAFIRSCKPKLVRMYRPDPVDVSQHLLTKLQNNAGAKPEAGFELQQACKSILPLLCDGDLRACQNTLNTINIAKAVALPAKTASSAAVVVDLCEASPTVASGVKKTVVDPEIVDLTASSPKVADKKVSDSAPVNTSEVETITDTSIVETPLFGTFLSENLNLDFAVFDHLGRILASEVPNVTGETTVVVKTETVNQVAQRQYTEGGACSTAAVVVPIVTAVEPRTMLSCDNNVIRIFGKHFLQSVSADNILTVEVLLNETPLKESVVVSDCVIAAVVPSKVFAAGVYSVVVRLSLKVSPVLSQFVRSDICGSAGGWLLINDRVFKSLKTAPVILPGANGKNSKKSTKPIAKTMELFVFGSAPTVASASVVVQSPKASGKRLHRSADMLSPSKKARKEDTGADDDAASVNTEATEDVDEEERPSNNSSNETTAKLPVRRRLQVCDDDDEDMVDEVVGGEKKVEEDAQSVHSAGLTESTVDEKSATVSVEVVRECSSALHGGMVDLLRDLMSPALSEYNSYFLNVPLSGKEAIAANAMDLTTVENMLMDKLYVKSATFQSVTEHEFFDLETFVQDVRSVWTNCLNGCDSTNSVQLLHACMLSELFEKSLKERLTSLTQRSASFNDVPSETVEAPLSVIESGSVSLHLYNVPVGHVEEFSAFSGHAMYASWVNDSRFRDLSTLLTNAPSKAVEVVMDTTEDETPAAAVSLEEYTPSHDKLMVMLSESHASRVRLCSCGEKGAQVKVEFGQEYCNEDSPMVFAPFKSSFNSNSSGKVPNDEADLACLDSLLDLAGSLDLLSSMDILNTRAVIYCNYADAYIAPPASSSASATAAAAANASITETNNDFDSMYERFALGGEEMYDHIPDEVMVNHSNTSNSSELSECNFATFQRSGVCLSDAGAIVRNGVLNLTTKRITSQLADSGRSDRYTSAYRYHLTSYKHFPTTTGGEPSDKVSTTGSKSSNKKGTGRLTSGKRSSDYCSSSDDDEDEVADDDSDDEGVFIDSESEVKATPASESSKTVCTRESLEKTLDSPYLSFMTGRLAVIRGVLTTLCHEEYGVFDNCNHHNTLCPAMAMDLFPILVIMCRCEALHDSAESNSYSVGRSSFGSGRRSSRGRGGGMAAPEKFINMKLLTQLTESQLEQLMNLMKWSYK